ncbi:MAG: hypothetical protein ACE14L_00175 [Terriglobales bacterium]
MGHTFHKDDRHHLAYAVKKLNLESRLLVLHASGRHPKVDLALDSRRGPEAVHAHDIRFFLIVKPICEDGSIGIYH